MNLQKQLKPNVTNRSKVSMFKKSPRLVWKSKSRYSF